MSFVLLTLISGIVLAVVPVVLVRLLRKKWEMPKGVFWKAGLCLLVIEVFYITLVSNAAPMLPAVITGNPISNTIFFAVFIGLFFELGRYVVLDKVMKYIRSRKEGIYFGICWSALETILLGLMMLLGAYGMQVISSTTDLSSLLPGATTADIEQMKMWSQLAVTMAKNPILALTPILERVSGMIVDVALTLLMIFGFYRGTTKFVWVAVLLRVLFSASVTYAASKDILTGEAVYLIYASLALILIKELKKLYPAHDR
jgi:uncharacterized membrane protein YhfC